MSPAFTADHFTAGPSMIDDARPQEQELEGVNFRSRSPNTLRAKHPGLEQQVEKDAMTEDSTFHRVSDTCKVELLV